MSYDDWKLATPWDNEISVTRSYECTKCEEYNEDQEITTSRGADEIITYCDHCGEEQSLEGFGE
jgi:predicted SprT family Zn-dependent metalloprotease